MNTPGCRGLATVNSQWKTSGFFLSCMELEDKKTVPACRLLSVHLLVLANLFLWHTLTYRGLWGLTNLNNTGGSVRFLSRTLSLSSCLSLFPRYKSQPLMQKMVQLGSGSFAGQVWTKCQQFPVHPHSDSLTGAGKRPKGRQLTTGDMVQSIVLLSRVWRRQTLSSG